MVKVKLLFTLQRFTSLTNSQWQVIKKFGNYLGTQTI